MLLLIRLLLLIFYDILTRFSCPNLYAEYNFIVHDTPFISSSSFSTPLQRQLPGFLLLLLLFLLFLLLLLFFFALLHFILCRRSSVHLISHLRNHVTQRKVLLSYFRN